MVIQSTKVGTNSRIQDTKNKSKNNNPNFRGVGSALMNTTGALMNGIENGGFVASFLIQDTLGMTVPRTREGLYRDRDKKKTKFKDLNFKEACEVGIREFLSGPIMMFTPFLVFALTKKFIGKSTTTNTELLKRVGKNFTNAVKNKKSGSTAKALKETFYKDSVKQMVEHTTPSIAGKPQGEALINKTFENLKKMDELEVRLKTAKGHTFSEWASNLFRKNKIKSEKALIKKELADTESGIVRDFNEVLTTHSSNFELANKVKIDGEVFRTSDSVKAMRSYSRDAMKKQNIAEMTEGEAKNLEKASMAKRIFATVAASVATIASTSIVPKIYSILNPVAPGAMTSTDSAAGKVETPKQTKSEDKKGQVQFKGNVLKNLQFDRNQITPLLMAVLSVFGLIGPRVKAAVKRAPVEDDGKKNLIEVPEILTRDLTSTAAVVFGVPVLSKAMVNSYQKASGFVLTSEPAKKRSLGKKILDTINPLSKNQTFSNKEIETIYGHINNKEQLMNFAEFIDKNDGSLAKVFKTLKNGKSSFAGTAADLDSIAKLDRKAGNAKVIEIIKNTFDDAKVTKLMEPAKKAKNGKVAMNEMFKRARGLNATPKFVNTLILVPLFLGFVLPKLVYGLTDKNRKRHEAEKQARLAMNNTATTEQKIKRQSFVVPTKGTAFESMKKNNH